jgi:CheY-like chemotaxis protein
MAKILLVEDDELSREMLTWRLDKKGYQVVVAADGIEGVELAQRESPDLILLDMSLPGMDGWTAAGQLKAAEATSAIPIVALTAHAMSGDREKALAAGCDDYDTKPVDFPRLLEKIETQLARTRSA